MSRGLGRIQRDVLAALEPHDVGLSVSEIAAAVYGGEPTEAQLVSVRRAIRRLNKAGLVWSWKFKSMPTGRRDEWGKGETLSVRTWKHGRFVTDEDRERRREWRATFIESLERERHRGRRH